MLWVRGEVVSDDALSVRVQDRTFEHGIGLFETLRTWNGHPTLLKRHLERLRNSARELGLPLDSAQLPDAEAVAKLIGASSDILPSKLDARLRITLSGGLPTDPPSGSVVWMSASPLPARMSQAGMIIRQAIEVPADDPLARHKTLNYWRKRIAYDRALEGEADEVLCVTHDRLVCESSRANIFFVRQSRLSTPHAEGTLLPGVMRQVVLERARSMGMDVTEEAFPIEHIATADEAFLTNSMRGIIPIARLMDARFPAPGPVTRELWSNTLNWLGSGGS
jgi:branched-subunit amino acid aminotransferase/4-amino-4-deoxychorismate lyase